MERLDVQFLSLGIIVALVAMVAVGMMNLTDPTDVAMEDLLGRNNAGVHVYVPIAPSPTPPKIASIPKPPAAAPRAPGKEGRFGERQGVADAARSRTVAEKRQHDEDVVNNTGLLRALTGLDTLRDITGGMGGGLNKALGGLHGSDATADAQGLNGLGTRGDKSGGGGDKLHIGAIGNGPDGSRGKDFGQIGVGPGEHHAVRPTDPPIKLEGGLTADEVGRVVRRHWNEIKACYERELNKNPNLDGKVAVNFVIGPVGDVTETTVREASLDDANVQECMLRHIRTWVFPPPRGGGTVHVNYPWVFSTN